MFDPAFVDWNLPATACPPEEREQCAGPYLARQLARLERMGLGQPFVMRPSALGLHWFPAGHWLVACGNIGGAAPAVGGGGGHAEPGSR